LRNALFFALSYIWQDKLGDLQKLSYGSETLGMTSEVKLEKFEADFVDTTAGLITIKIFL
jgi:hypothetical protein